jgi:RHS repeat-associated protein
LLYLPPSLAVACARGTEASCLALTHDQNGTRRTIVWDEENRIQSLFDNGHEKTYKYDALQGRSNAARGQEPVAADQGNRLIKRGPQGETVYVNQFYTQRPGATGTKHIYAGTTRIASKLVRQDTPNANPAGKTPFEKDLYFYHPDHLGTSNYITDLNAKLYEHLEYFPFGEAWVEENSNTQRTPYLFTAKELDEETGLYYYGARYYDPRTSVWQSADPILWKYLPTGNQKRYEKLPGIGGIYSSRNLAVFSYAALNPLTVVDPDGNEPVMNQVGTAFGFRSVVLDNSPNRVGLQTGAQAQATLQRFGGTEWTIKGSMPRTTYFNTATIRYVHTKSGGWIDMAHFTFYAGQANQLKQQGSANPVGDAMQRGYWQEATDTLPFRAPWSAYSYEDLPSDRLGAIFGAYVFDPTKQETLGEQIETFLNLWGADSPLNAPNINNLPLNDAEARKAWENSSPQQQRAKQNRTTTPLHTLPDPTTVP